MKRLPNPWFVLPVALATAAGALIGRSFARVSCVSAELGGAAAPCGSRQLFFAIAGALIACAGAAVVTVLVILSLTEWRQYQRDRPPRTPPKGDE